MKRYALLVWKNEKMLRADFESKEDALKCKSDLEKKGLHAQITELEVK